MPRRPSRARKKKEPLRAAELVRLLPVARRVLGLVFRAQPLATVALLVLTLVSGLLPAAIAWVGKQIVDSVVATWLAGSRASFEPVLWWVLLELGLVAGQRLVERGLWLTDSLLRTVLGQSINERILEKALTLELTDIEDAETYDLMSRARRGASYRPLSFVLGGFGLIRNAIALAAYGVVLWELAPIALVVVVLAAVPAFLVETRFSEDAFRLFRWRAPETREQSYLEAVVARQDHAKEVKLFDLGALFLGRYRAIFQKHYAEDRDRTVRQAIVGYLLGLLGLAAFYGCYAWVALRTVRRTTELPIP